MASASAGFKPVTIYTQDFCPYCTRAKALLTKKGVTFTEINVTDDDEMRAKLVGMSGGSETRPQIFIGGEYSRSVLYHAGTAASCHSTHTNAVRMLQGSMLADAMISMRLIARASWMCC
jgi:glutaredoxin